MTIKKFRCGAKVAVSALALTVSVGLLAPVSAQQNETLLLQMPSLGGNTLAFQYAGDIWVSNKDGSGVRRLTTDQGDEQMPHVSPDGKTVAFSANYNGNYDVYTLSVNGGSAKRLSYHPGADLVRGWTPDGKGVTFSSSRERMGTRGEHMYSVAASGGFPAKYTMPVAYDGALSGDGQYMAYMPFGPAYSGSSAWRLYRGGRVPPIWIFNTNNSKVEEVPHGNFNDTNPMWVGDTVYFLSDRDDKSVQLYSYKQGSKKVNLVTGNKDWDITWASANDGTIVYEAGGKLYSYDLGSKKTTGLSFSLNPDLPSLRPAWKSAAGNLQNASLSPSGKRVLVSARGEVFSVPTGEDGDTRNLTRAGGSQEKDAVWSPDGQSVAYISDASGEHKIIVGDQTGIGETKSYDLGDPAFYFILSWGGDGSHIVYRDNHLNLFTLNMESGKTTKFGQNHHRAFGRGMEVAQSSDGKWIAYTELQDNIMGDLKLYNIESGNSVTLSDGISDVTSPVFSKDGQYLYFAASTNIGHSTIGLDMTSDDLPRRYGLYAVVLDGDGKSPLLPSRADEENKDDEKQEVGETGVDLEGLQNRIVALPVAEKNYSDLATDADGALYFLDTPQAGSATNTPGTGPQGEIMRFDFKSKKASSFMGGVSGFDISHDGKMVLAMGRRGSLKTSKTGSTGKGKPVSLSKAKVLVNPREEWAQIFDDVWRLERDYYWDPDFQGLDWNAMRKRYEPFLAHVGRRDDLNIVIRRMIAEQQVGHNRAGGGDVYRPDRVNVGLLGANIALNNGKYQITKVLNGEKWNPFVTAPLGAPGIGVNEGDYILSVNGETIADGENFFKYFENTAGSQTFMTVSANADGSGAREVVVEPEGSERFLRLWAWVEDNRRKVDAATNGQVGYVYLPNTAGAGFSFFNRMFFSQANRKAMIIDERGNGGGQAANYITDVLSRTYISGWKDRAGMIYDTPAGAHHGPKVMLIDQNAGSGGDLLPWMFRAEGIGKLIGTRTWGGLVGIGANPRLVDGGFLSVPYFRFFSPKGEWRIENEGVSPDIKVEQIPEKMLNGHDPQLEAGIAEVLEQLKTHKNPRWNKAPKFPTRPGGIDPKSKKPGQ